VEKCYKYLEGVEYKFNPYEIDAISPILLKYSTVVQGHG